MMTKEENDRLTQIGPGTPAGELLRRYWHPIAASADLLREPVVPVRILGENLVLFRSDKGELGLVAERCPHRSASLAYGIPEQDGIRCPYHGWYFSLTGRCIEQPYDDLQGVGKFKDKIRIAAYPVQELGGFVFAYLGPEPAPLLPRWDIAVEEGLVREIVVFPLACNWLQIAENRLDPVHAEWLHVYQTNWVARKAGYPPPAIHRRHVKIDFKLHEFGIMKRRLLEGEDPETAPDWVMGHTMLFPNALGGTGMLQFDVPVDDTHTINWHYHTRPLLPGEAPQQTVPAYEASVYGSDGRMAVHTVGGQDSSAWVQQGPVAPREFENLGRSDRGILMYRKWLSENIEKVARGEDPDGLIRDPALNEPCFDVPGYHGSRVEALGMPVGRPPAMTATRSGDQ
jgi:5,5'-dehydrodivanillate O-demethylase